MAMTNEISNVKFRSLTQVIEKMHDKLLTGIRILIWKMGMAVSKQEADDLAYEILSETVTTAFRIADRYELGKSAHAWLMSIATNKIKEMRTKEYRRSKRMGVANETFQSVQRHLEHSLSGNVQSEQITEDEMIDFLVARNVDTNPICHKIHLSFDELVSLVSPDDQLILKLAFVDNLKGKDLAAFLQTSIGAANVRLSRAINRIRKAPLASEASERSER
jgi:RNA polymerase sigma factor (sigma-70 family)